MTARRGGSILIFAMGLTALTIVWCGCATTRLEYDRQVYLECLSKRPQPVLDNERWYCMDIATPPKGN